MENDKPKKAFAKWFGVRKSNCCNVKIEEIQDAVENKGDRQSDEKVQHGENNEKPI